MTRAAVTSSGPGRPEELDPNEVRAILARHNEDRGGLIATLQDVQARCGYLPADVLRTVAAETGQSMVDVYGIATFYSCFSLTPRGRHIVSACLGTACHVRGSARVVDELRRQLGIEAGETTEDGEFSLETVNCLGACALGPVVVIDGHYFSKVGKARVRQLLDEASAGFDKAGGEGDERVFPIEAGCPRCNHSLMDRDFPIDGHPSIRLSVSCDHKHGWLRLSALYGSGDMAVPHEIPDGTVVSFFCPYCHERLIAGSACPDCGAPMVPMIVRGGGIVQICSRRGCLYHLLDLV